MPKFTNPFNHNAKTSTKQTSHRKTSSLHSSIGQSVQPGRVLSKEEREQRKAERADSAVGILDGQADAEIDYDTEHTWRAFRAKLLENADTVLRNLGSGIEPMFPPDYVDPVTGERHYNLRRLIASLIVLLIVYGVLWRLYEYLPSVSRASACSVSTVYFPVTYTVTAGSALIPFSQSSNDTQPTTTRTSTTTQVSTITQTETVTSFQSDLSSATSVQPVSSGPATYEYTVNSAGVTDWANGLSPTSGVSLVTMTTTIVMQPVPSTDLESTTQTTTTELVTVTPPAYTSTIYSYAGPDLTSTSTSTHYVTLTLSEVSRPASITTTRTSFPGVSSDGWNATSPADSGTSANVAAATHDPVSTTITAISYFGTGDQTTSTTTMYITTTIAEVYTTTISQVIESPSGSGYVTTVTAVPVTITPGASGPLFSTSVTLPGPNSISNATSRSLSSKSISTSSSSRSSSFSDRISSTITGWPHLSSESSQAYSNSSNSSPSTGQSQPSRNATFSSVSRSMKGSQSPSSKSKPTDVSITNTISIARMSNSHSSVSPQSAQTSILQITNTRSRTSQLKSSKSSVMNVPSAIATTVSNSPSDSSQSQTSTQSRSLNNATMSSAGYGYPSSLPPFSSTHSISLSVVNTFTSMSSVSVIPGPANSSPSTLATSFRSSSSESEADSSIVSSAAPTSSILSTSRRDSTSSTRTGNESNSDQATEGPSSPPTSDTVPTPSSTNPFPASSATAKLTGGCGEQGNFTADFDDLPSFFPTNSKNTTITEAPPVLNPYHHLTFSEGYVYAPQPDEPYLPSSKPHLAVLVANATGRTASPFGDLVRPGEIGDGPRDPISAFWFDANNAMFGCDNLGPGDCTLVLSAYAWDEKTKKEEIIDAKNVTIPPCPSMKDLNCQLQPVEFPESFRSLTGLQVQAYADNEPRMFFMDDLEMRWSNNSCAAGLLRQSSR